MVSQIKAEGEKRKDVTVLKQLDYFGEVALIHGMPRVATVTAKGPVTCVKLDKIRSIIIHFDLFPNSVFSRFKRLLNPVLDQLRRNIQQYKSLVPLSM